ncbi:MAG TPA: DNA repair protein RecO [Thermoanaerobaculia bacterium]|jgi:DNA repair protein RecO (recombination protein O)|nr:DNA repair protein RecO [Thermoanaerobaculia bacterium]
MAMRFLHDEALLLEVSDLQEGDRVVSFLTRQHGRKRGAARGARRRYSRFAGQLQPLAKVHVSWFEREDRDLVRVRGVEMVRPPHRLQADLEGILLGYYLAEHALTFAPENEGNELLFRLLDSTLEALLAGVDRQLAARYFEQWTLRLAGVFPPPRDCPLCGADLAAGALLPSGGDALLCRGCAGGAAGIGLDAETLAFLLRVHREPLAILAATPPSPAVLARVEQVCGEVRRGFLQHELKSYLVMQRTLAAASR